MDDPNDDEPLSNLTQYFAVRRAAIDHAGGYEALHSRFAARLREHFAGCGESFHVWSTNVSIFAEEQPTRVSRSLCLSYQAHLAWIDDKTARYLLRGVDGAGDEADARRDSDFFALLFAGVRQLIGQWPEVADAFSPATGLLRSD